MLQIEWLVIDIACGGWWTDRMGFFSPFIRKWIIPHYHSQSLFQHSETAQLPLDFLNSTLRKHFGSKEPPNSIKYSASRWWRYSSVVHLLKAGTDVRRFLFRVRVGTEANQLTVNKWSQGFYRVGERKPECHSTSSEPPHTLTHTHWLSYTAL